MALIEWRDEFSVGVPSVDYEHQELIELINKVHREVNKENAEISIEEYLGEIYVRVAAHFALEERIMRDAHYDEYEEHKAEHERLLDDIRDIMDDYENRSYYNENEFSDRLSEWFAVHFKTKDARLHRKLG